MALRLQTPLDPDTEPLTEGIVVQVGPLDIGAEQALQLARQVVGEVLSGEWEIEPLNLSTQDFQVRKAGETTISIAEAWDLTFDLREHRNVVSAEPAFILPGIVPTPSQIYPKDEAQPSFFFDQNLACSHSAEWPLDLCKVSEAWKLPLPEHGFGKRRGEGIVIGHPDTGYTRHPEIWDPARLLVSRGFDFEDSDRDPQDRLVGMNPGHGTATASVIMSAVGAQAGNPYVSGVAPAAQIVPLRVSTSVIHLSYGKLARSISYAADSGHHVISMSLGGPVKSDYLQRTIRDAIRRGVILLSASGNYWPWVVYPAAYPEVVAVAACNCQRAIWSGASTGTAVDVTAPGESVWCASARNGSSPYTVGRSSGTSFAVAITAGICALWLAHHGRDRLVARYGARNLAGVFKEILVRSGVDTPANWDRQKHGAGIVNAVKVLRARLPDTAPANGLYTNDAGQTPRQMSGFDEVAAYFPTTEPMALRRVLAGILKTEDRQLENVLGQVGDELQFHIATNPTLRTSIDRLSNSALPMEANLLLTPGQNVRLEAHASKRLRVRLGI